MINIMESECKIDDFVTISLRIRPPLREENTDSSCLQVISKQPPVLLVLDRAQTYHFDNIFKEEIDQETIYKETVKPLVEYVKQGYSCTVFAYGQTGTGKTYTMGTSSQTRNSKDAGLIPRALEQFFTSCGDDIEIDLSVSFLEIYNEKVFDLLQNNKPPLTVKGFQVKGLSQKKIFNCGEAKHFLLAGNKNRHSSETKQNSNSSRSHAVFTIHCLVKHKDYETTAKLNLVDLAGCESVGKTGNQGSTFQEGVNINMGLLCIGQVMTALSTNASFVPYRQSIITTILQDSLNRKNLVSLIACVKSNPEDCNETLQTLEFAQRVKKMKNKPEVNEVITQYKKDHPTLFQPIKTSNTPFKRPGALFQTPCLTKKMRTLPPRTVNETSGMDSSKSLSSISISSVMSNVDVAQQSLSPVIKKYMAAMESSLVDRIEVLIKDTLKRPRRSLLLAKEKDRSDKENTPSMSWDKIQNEVSKLVRTEIVQLTSKAARAASSPIDEHVSFSKIRKVLKYESPVLEGTEKENSQKNASASKEETVFKVPELPVIKKKSAEHKRNTSISPIEFTPRRSTRLSLKKTNNNLGEGMDLNSEDDMSSGRESEMDISNFNESLYEKRRRSMRLTKKQNNLRGRHTNANVQKDNEYEWKSKDDQRNMNKSKENFKEEAVFKVPELRVIKKPVARKPISSGLVGRRSLRILLKRSNDDFVEDSSCDHIEDDMSLSDISDIDKSKFNESHYEKKRHRVRLPKKIESKDRYLNTSSREKYNNSLDDFDLEATAEVINKHASGRNAKMPEFSNKKRKSCRLNKATNSLTKDKVTTNIHHTDLLKATPAVKKIWNSKASIDSPATARTKQVLTLVNNGTVKELEKLHSIGPKTAQQILLFREIKGPLKKISDLSLMPGWHGKKFKMFVEQNFVKNEF